MKMFWSAANKKVEPPKVAVKPVWIRVYLETGSSVTIKASSFKLYSDRMIDFLDNDVIVASFQGRVWLYYEVLEGDPCGNPPLNSDSQ